MDVSYHTRYPDEEIKPRFNAVLDVSFSSEGSEPVTTTEAKNFCRIDVTDDDTLIGSIITAARQVCENYSGISFITRTITATLQNSCGNIYLPYGPVSTISSYLDRDGNAINDPKVYGEKFKFIQYPTDDYLKVTYSAGYSTIPPNLKTALLNQIQWMYDNRGQESANRIAPGAEMILKLIRRV